MSSSDRLIVSRVSGAQNTFLIVNTFGDHWKKIYPVLSKGEKQEIAKKLCGSFFGFKTDGLLFLHSEKNFDFAWDFFNSDGSFAEMCGNAARCASMYFYQKIEPKKKIHFFTGAGSIDAEILSDEIVKVEMSEISAPKKMNVLGIDGLFVDTGVPHFIIEQKADTELAKRLRKVSDFGPAGANITFVENLKNNSLAAVTFERGVEDYTQACGTGAVAAAIFYQAKNGPSEQVRVLMPGGELLVKNAGEGLRPLLIGPAILEFDLVIDKKNLIGEK